MARVVLVGLLVLCLALSGCVQGFWAQVGIEGEPPYRLLLYDTTRELTYEDGLDEGAGLLDPQASWASFQDRFPVPTSAVNLTVVVQVTFPEPRPNLAWTEPWAWVHLQGPLDENRSVYLEEDTTLRWTFPGPVEGTWEIGFQAHGQAKISFAAVSPSTEL